MDSNFMNDYFEFEKRMRQMMIAKNEYFKVKKRVESLLEKEEKLVAAMEKFDDKNDPVSIIRWFWKCRKVKKTQDKLTTLTPAFKIIFQKWKDTIDAL